MRKSSVMLTAALVAVCFGIAVDFSMGEQPDPAATGGPATKATAPAGEAVMSPAHRAKADKLIRDGIQWLLSQREADGGWSLGKGVAKPAITAMVLKAFVRHAGHDPDHPIVKKGFEVLLRYKQKDGGFYDPKQGQQNYTTAVAVMALVAARNPKFQKDIDDAVKYLKGLQIVPGSESPDGQEIDKEHPFSGGVGYGEYGRPDLSNLGMWMQALHDAGVKGDDPAMQRALVFVTRTQNLSETNVRPWAKIGANDGGFVYAPAIRGNLDMGESKAEMNPGGRGLRSYGSMTYTGFKSLLYAAVDRKDPRARAAFRWIQAHWRLDSNPNMPALRSKEGLYYYYHVFAKALRAWGEPVITDRKGGKHNWREELIDTLASQVGKDGHWENDSPRWYERMPVLSTSYGVLALQEALRE
ncbi:MAG TPA: prenyltransferase/squalene oxidase repeat-containing protein [Phycisphaerae bacterium]|nr:prenyltransferase/squalene oxidase repeat-containing protein [Phycisphaerae bacterium]